MSKDILIRYYDAFNHGDRDAMVSMLADDVVHEPSQGNQRVGREAFGDFLDHMNKCYRERVIDPVFLISEDGSHGAAEFMLDGVYVENDDGLPTARGQNYRLRVGAFFVFEDGKITRVSNHHNLADWTAQVE